MLENYFPFPCKVLCPCAYTPVQSTRKGTRLCKEWENNFPTQLQFTVLLISSHFEHYISVSVARAQCKCIGHGPRSRFRSVRSEMKSTVLQLRWKIILAMYTKNSRVVLYNINYMYYCECAYNIMSTGTID